MLIAYGYDPEAMGVQGIAEYFSGDGTQDGSAGGGTPPPVGNTDTTNTGTNTGATVASVAPISLNLASLGFSTGTLVPAFGPAITSCLPCRRPSWRKNPEFPPRT